VVRLDLERGRLFLRAGELDLTTLDASNGVEVAVFWGEAAAVETIDMQEGWRNRLFYARDHEPEP
jgi:hypothetical protein